MSWGDVVSMHRKCNAHFILSLRQKRSQSMMRWKTIRLCDASDEMSLLSEVIKQRSSDVVSPHTLLPPCPLPSLHHRVSVPASAAHAL